jgi:membrane protein YqaA with SNARE-associated domain
MGLALAGAIVRQHQSTLVITSSAAGATTGTTCRWSLRYAAPLQRAAGAPAHALSDQPQSPLDQPATQTYEEVV